MSGGAAGDQHGQDILGGADPSEAGVRRGRRLAVVATAAVGLALGAAGVAAAADDPSPSPSPTSPGATAPDGTPPAPSATDAPAPDERKGPGGPGFGRHGHRGGPGSLGGFGALHGEYVTADPDGGYQTVRVQRGEVTAVNEDTITLESEDGYTATYRITDDTVVRAGRDGVTGIKVGSEAAVTATVEGDVATATRIGTRPERGEDGVPEPEGGRPGRDGDRPTTAPTPSATTTS